jgi:hypothetical protein
MVFAAWLQVACGAQSSFCLKLMIGVQVSSEDSDAMKLGEDGGNSLMFLSAAYALALAGPGECQPPRQVGLLSADAPTSAAGGVWS